MIDTKTKYIALVETEIEELTDKIKASSDDNKTKLILQRDQFVKILKALNVKK